MELTKQDSLKAKGVAIIGMIMLHLFCRLGELPYDPLSPLLGKYPKECKIFSYYNLGNMRKIEMFVTDKNFKQIDVPKTIVTV
jgi:hypothetical protein